MLDDPTIVTGALFALLAALVAVAGWTDVTQRRIPNWVSGVTLLGGLAATFAQGGWGMAGGAAAHFVAALLVGMALTAARWIGAGDAKFYAALAAWLPIQMGLWLLVSVSLAGLVLVLAFAMKRRGRIRRTSADQSDFDKLPYGLAIGLGGLLAIAFA